MAKEANGNVKVRWLLGIVVGALGFVLSTGMVMYGRFDTDRAIAQAVTITEHAVKIATTEETVRGVRADVAELKAEVKVGLGENSKKLDELLRRKN